MDLRRNEQKEERKLEEMGRDKTSRFEDTRTYCHRRCKSRKTTTSIESLPDVMLFNILVQLPVQYIYEVIRFVCWKWYRIIHTRDFVYEHLKQSSKRSLGILIQARMPLTSTHLSVRAQGLEPLTYVSLRQQGCERSVEISMVSCTAKSAIWTSCNGMLLLGEVDRWVRDKSVGPVYYIENPTTKQRVFLPKFDADLRFLSSLAYVPASMEYKVVVTHRLGKENHCVVLTVGVDSSWRHIKTDHLSSTARPVLDTTPLATEGFVHWIGYPKNIVVTLNAETETLKEFHLPQGYPRRCLSTGTSYLSIVVRDCNASKFSWEVREMNPETGGWTRLPNIDLEAHRNLLIERGCSDLQPIGWLKYKEVILFNNRKRDKLSDCLFYFAYDAHTQKIYPFELQCVVCRFLAHVKSLVCLDAHG